MTTSDQIKEHLQQLAPLAEITPRDYSDIELTEDEVSAALLRARIEKDQDMKRRAYAEKINANPVWYEPTAEQMKGKLLTTTSKTGNPFRIVDAKHEAVINQLCLYFSKSPTYAGDPKKGILLRGKPGSGKTHLMNFFCKNPKASYSLPTCKIVVERYAQGWNSDDRATIEFYSALKKAEFDHIYSQKVLGFCFGDLGAEVSESNSYGNKRNVMEEIIFNRYEANLDFCYTHFTTNLNTEELEKKYGSRFRDRLREMCNVYTLENESFRI